MSLKDEITAAVGAHGLWKGRLRDAIQSGKSDLTPQTARQDNQCKFGQWLHGPTMPAGQKSSPGYRECIDLHAKFHAAAARVLELAVAGKKAEAEQAMAPGSEFATVSRTLTEAMQRWQKAAA